MNRAKFLLLFSGLSVWLGATGDGCAVNPITQLDFRSSPAILSNTPQSDTRLRTLEVDLRSYPETDRINWDFGDGSALSNLSPSVGRTVTHEFARDGTFIVMAHLFTAGDPINRHPPLLITSGQLPIDILGSNKPPTAAFIVEDVFDDDGGTVPLMKRFVANSSRDPDGSIESYRWEFGDGMRGEGRTLEHTFFRSGRFRVRLTVIDERGGESSTTRTTLVNALPVATFTFTPDAIDPLTFNFDARSSTDADGEIRRYAWDFGDGSPVGNSATTSHTYAVPDNYTVTLTITDELGASVSTTRMLDVTGSAPFVRSISPNTGESDATLTGVTIDGENFVDGAKVRLERGATIITGSAVSVQSPTRLSANFDLTGASVGDYDVIVENPDGVVVMLPGGFSVVTANNVRITTNFGDIVIQMVDDAPITTANFLQYVEDGFYDGTIFHRVVPDFVVQGGGFLPGMVKQDGVRDPIVNEFSPERSNLRGSLAMAKLGGDPDSATSEFFFNLGDNSSNLDTQNGGFTVFAHVIEGVDIVDMIATVPLGGNSGNTPIDDVILIRAVRE